MEVSTWRGGTLGIRIRKKDRDESFGKDWGSVNVETNIGSKVFNLTETFWTTCPELRGGIIKKWLEANNLGTWPSRKPHRLRLIPRIEDPRCFILDY